MFLTLTYDTAYVPITKKGYMTLCKRCLQLFIKRLRKYHHKDAKIKYYAVGEYGGKTMRPHYHLILFNADKEKIDKAWNKGSIYIGTVEGASVGYTLKYLAKEKKIPLHKNDDRVKEFSLMSKGLGTSYLSENMKQWHYADINNRMYIPIEDNKKICMPRYYKDKLYTKEQRKIIGLTLQEREQKVQEELIKKHGDGLSAYFAEQHVHMFKRMFNNHKTEKL